MNQKNMNLEEKIKEIAKEYTQKGYSVFTNLEFNNVPDFLKNYSPDIIAISENDKVVIEVKTKNSLSKSKDLESLANLIEQQEGWRFELVVTNSKQVVDMEREDSSLNEISKLLLDAEELLNIDYVKASYILTWSSLESIIRKKLKNENIKSEYNNPIQMIKNLYTFGLITRDEYDFLHNHFKLRNLVVHGFNAPSLDYQITKNLINFAKNLN